jgi:hypothetical protein
VCIFHESNESNESNENNESNESNESRVDYTELNIIHNINPDPNNLVKDKNKKYEIELKHYSNDVYNKENKVIIIENLSNLRFRKIEIDEDFVII